MPEASDIREKLGIDDKFVILAIANKWLLQANEETLKVVTDKLDDSTVMVMIGCKESDRERLPKNVIPIEFIRDRSAMRQMYSMADVFVNCTREDSFSLVNVEAQACGTPTVTYSNTGARETVDGVCGFAVENGTPEALLEAINRIKTTSKANLSQECRAHVCKRFSKSENYLKYIELYNRVR